MPTKFTTTKIDNEETMKLNLTALAILLAASVVISCGDHHADSASHDGDNHEMQSPEEHSSEELSSAEHSPSVLVPDALARMELNEGQKWPMDDHTRASFAAMADSFLSTDYPSLEGEGLKQAGSELEVQLHDLIEGCTMAGPPHDQLHVFLSGYMPAVAALSHTGTVEDAERVQDYLQSYGDYFE